MVTGVPPTHFSETKILGLFRLYGASRVELLDALKGIARVVVSTPSDVTLACSGNVKIDASARKLLITPDDIRDAGVWAWILCGASFHPHVTQAF